MNLIQTKGGGDDLPDELKKHVAAIHVDANLSLVERKIVNILLLNAFRRLLDVEEHTISIALLSKMVWDTSRNREAIKKAAKAILDVKIEFDVLGQKSEDDEWIGLRALASAKIKGGVLTYSYAPELRRKLAEPHVFAMININIQKQFRSAYALALYENCVRFVRTESTGWITVQNWKRLLGVMRYDASGEPLKSAYDTFKVFRSKVITPAVDEVNAVSDITVTPEWERQGNTVTHIKFRVEKKAQQSLFDNLEAVASEGYKALQAIGCSEDLIQSILAEGGDERALELSAYVAEQDGIDNPAAYVRRLHDTHANVKKPKKKPMPTPTATLPLTDDEREKDRQADEARKASAGMSDEQRAALRAAYIAQNPLARFNEETGKWNHAKHITGFTTFMRTQQ